MEIIVLSDTHIPKRAKQLPETVKDACKQADLIIHAGDWQTEQVYNEIKSYGDLVGVTGNVDSPELKRLLNRKEIVSVEGFRIGIVHGHGKGGTTESRAAAAFAPDEVDCIVFGHSHIPVLNKRDGILLFNPGSPTDKRRQKQYSFGLITIGETIHARHVLYSTRDDKSEKF